MQTTAPDLLTWHPFHVSQWPKKVLRDPADYDGADKLSLGFDLGAMSESEKKRAIAQWCEKLPELTAVRWLSLWSHVTPPLFEAACKMPGLECLQIKWSNVRRLDSISGLANLRYLSIGSSTKVESVAPLASLTQLKLLDIENFKLITDFSPLEKLTSLESLAVTGSMWTRQDVGSLEPFARMTWLRRLALDTTRVASLRPLANLKNLEALDLGGRLPMKEYAWLSAKLPNTACRWFGPWLDLASTGIGRCVSCQQNSKVMLTGKGTKVLCRTCDQGRIAQHAAAFEMERQRSLAEG
ncbi:MAG TPA: leucine-rich repeat domain-containing protein [Arenimonas sp.]|uniref:leucine-rich repeat domain-containing protein n=1 Tax=Arenimonas sp. TaxID=1872635 RepID=UPI002B7136B7|nr:leucine-rich repeat domain-containing protein [Arenimonas sp.]HMB55960.1 leucine-rich repeat domain-containing protein [Arenimonas sp.]